LMIAFARQPLRKRVGVALRPDMQKTRNRRCGRRKRLGY
jgi:hypothetical protein